MITPVNSETLRRLDLRASMMVGEKIPNFLRVLAHSPVTLRACLDVNNILGQGLLTPQRRVQIALLMAEINSCRYSLSMYCQQSRRIGLIEEEIWLARKGMACDPADRAMLRFTLNFVLERGAVGPQAFNTLRGAGFSDAQIVEVIANIALNIFVNYFNVANATPVDFPLVAPGRAGAVPSGMPSPPELGSQPLITDSQ